MRVAAEAPVTALAGIGPKKAQLYEKLGVATVRQLLLHLPRAYLDLRQPAELDALSPGDESPRLIRAHILSKSGEQRIRKGFSVFKVRAEADGLELLLTFYNTRYTVSALPVDGEVFLYGPVGGTLLRREMKAPAVVPPALVGTFAPVYPCTTGLSSRVIAQDIRRALDALEGPLTDCVPETAAAAGSLPSLWDAVKTVHRPDGLEAVAVARSRIALEELFTYSAAMLLLRGARTKEQAPPMQKLDPAPFYASLPYVPTGAQLRAVEDVRRDLASGRVMSRMVQGDVGSGKTLIAAAAIYLAAENGFQTALMAPTEILAEQHLRTFSAFFAPFGIRVELLTGATPVKERRRIGAALAAGEISLLLGTHALFQEGVEFKSLGLVVTDEQHRFGVAQRAALSAKGSHVHTLVMSATPIPRTLSLILYGDLDLSVVDELPAGRKPVATYRIDSGKRDRALGFIRKHLDAGEQAYVVCPLVEEGEGAQELKPAVQLADELAKGAFAGYRVGLLHGRLKPKEKDAVMRRFAAGEIQLLVATTVVEVGMDVPNATVMLIENAERFGLSQLHQLRGRIGRGSAESCCILVSDAQGETAKKRLSVLKSTNDGFRIAQEDLRLRGPGELLGLRQSGLPNIDLVSDPALFELAQNTAASVLRDDPLLSKAEHAILRGQVALLTGHIGEQPN